MPRLTAAARHLAGVDPVLGAFIARTGPVALPARDHAEPYAALFHAVAHQQLHANAANAMLRRLMAHSGGALPAPAALLALPIETIRACGFSANKTLALRDIAAHAAAGTIPSRAAAARLPDDALIARLLPIRGVGRWTVEMLLIFTLKRPDVFPVDDFGVREGYRLLHNLPTQPKPKPFAEAAKPYAPHRSTAALYLWRAADLAKVKTKA